jgi:hypothetical protein
VAKKNISRKVSVPTGYTSGVIPLKNKPIKRYGVGNDSITTESSPEIIRDRSALNQ